VRPRPSRLLDVREFPLLYVDDEPENLRIFELTFRRDFTVLTANDAAEGMQVLNENPVAVVLSDQKMPGMSGVEFLTRVRELDPGTVRILVTAYGNAETLSGAINDGSIYRYVSKPWDPEDMRVTLRRAIEAYALEREREALLSELSQINRLSRDLHRQLELPRLIDTLLRAAHRDLGFDGAALLFFIDETRESLHWAGVRPEDATVDEALRAIEMHSGNARDFLEAVSAGQPQTLSMGRIDELERPLQDWLREVSADEILVVPLAGNDGVIGILAVDNRSGGRRFGADDRTLLDGVALQAVIALENARLVEDLRRSREQVERGDRLGTLGTLAAGLAHEINNPLVSISTFLTLAPEKTDHSDREFWQEYHQLTVSELERIRGLVSTMSRLAHGGERGRPSPVDLGLLASEVITLLARESSAAGVELLLDCDADAPKVRAIRDQMHQVLLNLILNAIQACEPGGWVRTRIRPGAGHRGEERGQWVEVEVQDCGCGIAGDALERIFDPFFTTKDPDQGTGLGLMISHRIVEDHGGEIEVESRVGEGTTLRLHLPVEGPDPAAGGPAGGSGAVDAP